MKSRTLLALAAVPLFAASVAAGPPVTSPDAPSPAAEVTRQWMIAALQAPLLGVLRRGPPPAPRRCRCSRPPQRREKLGPGVGWYGPSHRRHDWAWLAGRFDADRDGRITRQELAGLRRPLRPPRPRPRRGRHRRGPRLVGSARRGCGRTRRRCGCSGRSTATATAAPPTPRRRPTSSDWPARRAT